MEVDFEGELELVAIVLFPAELTVVLVLAAEVVELPFEDTDAEVVDIVDTEDDVADDTTVRLVVETDACEVDEEAAEGRR